MPDLHSMLSPSAAERWMNCFGSGFLSEGMPEKTSKYADEGTLAHALGEHILTENPNVFTGAVDLDQAQRDEMLANVRIYTDYINELMKQPGAILHVEQQVKITENCWGTSDATVWAPKSETLYINDLKYGAGIPVSVRGNLQLKLYGLGALLTCGYPADIINVAIIQPRIRHEDGCVRSVDYDAVDLIEFHADVLAAENKVLEANRDGESDMKTYGYLTKFWEDTYLHPTEKGCRFCLAAPKCPKLLKESKQLASQVFGPTQAYNPKELAEVLDRLPLLEGWIKNVREFAYNEAEAGRVPPTYKLVEKRAIRKWKDNVVDICLMGVLKLTDESLVYKPKDLLPVGDILKLCPGKNVEERSKVLEPFTVKESSGHTLVPESDKRESVRLDAKATFSEEKK